MRLWIAATCLLFASGVQAQAPDAEIFLGRITRAAGTIRIEALENITNRVGYDNQPHFAPGGDALYYTRIDERGQADIWRYALPARTASAVTRTAPESEYSATPIADGGIAVIRVEADSTQRLWRFALDGSNPSLIFSDVKPVGYQAWLDDSTAALFVLGSPASLQIARRGTPGAVRVADDIGRALQPVPGGGAVSFVHRRPDGTWLRVYQPGKGPDIRPLAAVPVDSTGERPVVGEYHAWLPDGTVLATAGARLFALAPGGTTWQLLADYRERGWTLSRIAVDRAGQRIALVVEQRR